MARRYVITGLVFGVLAVICGAFGAHGLKKVLDPDILDSFETGVKYQMYHALLLIATSGFYRLSTASVYWCITLGTLLFSGSIYLLSLDELIGMDLSAIALSTPLGGLLLIIGWLLLLIKAINSGKTQLTD